ncbi:HAAS signaling domain-containing protein [Fulvivirga ligni]|uniref:HAAS signaling domain-containing protein n=1 Tax=Fulvivirga ligni TaxID=2904246 RepID=UPI001F1CD203|nr:hypothetical protein [Fulvivirga ligni]UII19924.1 hypothetical protein LVD16_18950 [Fulvivirga ligni]
MEFRAIEFKDTNAQRVYNNYIATLKNVTKPLSTSDSQEVLMEFNSHIYEHLQQTSTQPELERLLNIIDKLGAPEEVLRPLVADKLLEKATKSFNPVDVLRALSVNITNGLSYAFFALLYLTLGGFVFLIFAKLFNHDQVGMFYQDDKFTALGMVKNSENYQEVLGDWFIPAMILSAVITYILITLLLKIKKSFNKKTS